MHGQGLGSESREADAKEHDDLRPSPRQRKSGTQFLKHTVVL